MPNLSDRELLEHYALLAAVRLQQIGQLKARLLESKRHHYYCEDCWYSCPKSEDGSCNSFKDGECDCGAEEFNRELEEFIAKF